MNNKFKQGQRVMIPDFTINGSKMDIDGVVDRYVLNQGTKKWAVEVIVNNVRVSLFEPRIEDWDAYWDRKKTEKEALDKEEVKDVK